MRKIIGALVLVCAAHHAQATPTTNAVVYPQTPNEGLLQFLQGTDSAGTYKTLYTAGANGSVCFGMSMSNSEASTTHLITIAEVKSAVKYVMNSPTTVAGAGFGSTSALVGSQSIIGTTLSPGSWTGLPADQNGNFTIQLASGDTLQITFTTAFVTSGAVINFRITCNDF